MLRQCITNGNKCLRALPEVRFGLQAAGRLSIRPDSPAQLQLQAEAPVLPPPRDGILHAQDGELLQRRHERGGEAVHEGQLVPRQDGSRLQPVIQQGSDLEGGQQARGEEPAAPGVIQVDGMRRQGLVALHFIFGEFLDAGRAGEGQNGLLEAQGPYKGHQEKQSFHSSLSFFPKLEIIFVNSDDQRYIKP